MALLPASLVVISLLQALPSTAGLVTTLAALGPVEPVVDVAAQPESNPLGQFLDRLTLRLQFLNLRVRLWWAQYRFRRQEEQFRRLEEKLYRDMRQFDVPRFKEEVPNRLPPGQRRV
jgi:hypothetical protein